ncbi:hypothetical protein ACFY7H_13770 [Streptomyces sp. NPDC012794]|uniref:hypothetical protein n=1 Tax=Streptomyces sp. NPDC012794 TaxID=3364850 RepID=UPI0036D13DBE
MRLLALLAALAAWALPATPPAAAEVPRVESWGHDSFAELGDGTTFERHTPVTVAGLTAANTTSPAAGGGHGLALLSSGALRAWGDNSVGRLGNGSTTNSGTPLAVRTGIPAITLVSAGGLFSLAA